MTVTVCWQELVLACTSTTIQMTVVVPIGKVAGAVLPTLATPQLSEVTGVPRLTPEAEHWPALALVNTLAGQVMLGGCVSVTVTVWVQELVRPCTSVTVQMTVVVPTGKVAGALLTTV